MSDLKLKRIIYGDGRVEYQVKQINYEMEGTLIGWVYIQVPKLVLKTVFTSSNQSKARAYIAAYNKRKLANKIISCEEI